MNNMTIKIFACLLLSVAIVVFLFIYSLNEPRRMVSATEKFRVEAVERGVKIFEKNCVACHGGNGQGIEGLSKPINSKGFLTSINNSTLKKAISYGLPNMPAFSREMNGQLNANDIKDVISFIRNWESDSSSSKEIISEVDRSDENEYETLPTETVSIDLSDRDVKKGAALYTKKCAICHGKNGEDETNEIVIHSQEFLKYQENEAIFDTINTGIPGEMPAYGEEGNSPLSEDEIWNIVAFIRSWEK